MTFKLPELTFDYNALEPYMDAQTVEIHHSKHHAGYTKKLNSALEEYPEYFEKSIEQILAGLNELPEGIRNAVRNNGGGYYHHNLWWVELSPEGGGEPIGQIAEAIKKEFNDFVSFKEKFNAEAIGRFGSGWAWLCKREDKTLILHSTPNQDSPIILGLYPLLTIDVWEHAYYLKYQNRRNEFVEAFWNMVNWDVVEKRFLEGSIK